MVGVLPARLLSRDLDGVGGEVDAIGVKSAPVRNVEEQPVAAPEVEQAPAPPVSEQPAEGHHRHPVAADPLTPVLAGEELGVLARRVQVAEPLRADARMPEQQAALGAADDVVIPARRLVLAIVGVQQRL